MLPEKKEKKFCLGSWIIKKISGTWEVPFALPFPRFPHSYCSVDGQSLNCIKTTTSPPRKYLVWLDLFFFPDTEMSTLRRSPTLQVSWTVYYRLMLNHLTTEQARRTHREWIKFTTLCVNRSGRWSCRSVWARCRE